MIGRRNVLRRLSGYCRRLLSTFLGVILVIWLMTGSLSEAQFKDKTPAPAFPRRGGRPAPAQAVVNAPNTFWCAVFSPDGKTLAGVGGAQETPGKLMVWDLATAKLKFQANETKGIRSLAYTPDGKTLALALYNGKVKLLDAASFKE